MNSFQILRDCIRVLFWHQRPFRGLSKRHPQPASSPCKSETIRSLGVLAALRYRRAVQNVFACADWSGKNPRDPGPPQRQAHEVRKLTQGGQDSSGGNGNRDAAHKKRELTDASSRGDPDDLAVSQQRASCGIARRHQPDGRNFGRNLCGSGFWQGWPR